MRKKGMDFKGVSDKMVKFGFAYTVHGNGRQSVIDAGYSPNGAAARACRLLENPKIRALIGRLRREQSKRFVVQSDEVLEHLVACMTRDGKDFVDEKGRLLIDNLNDLPDRVTKAIDGIKQKRKVYTLPDGTEVEEIETELKLVPKAVVIRMAMEHRGLFAAQEVTHKMAFDFDQLYFPPEKGDVIDVEGKVE
jgi:phage terminase small subunit